MIASVIISGITLAVMIASVLAFPKVTFGKITLSTYWIVSLTGAAVLLATGQVPVSTVGSALIADNAINPIKILVLFISMTILSIYLDELGFFRYLANVTLKRAGHSQYKLFLYLYVIVSVLTVFTSNDIIILSFTPFICYFAKNARISPIPYLAAEFVAANTWSMALIIGNPTNIYIATAYDIGFMEYVGTMILPTLAAGVVAFGALFLLFRKKLTEPISGEAEEISIRDRVNFVIGIVHLSVCTVALAVSSYLPGVEMWTISLGAVVSLFLCTAVSSLIRRTAPTELGRCLARAPWELIPFIISMFVIIVVLSEKGVTGQIADFLGKNASVWSYGTASFLSANVVNNIPMSVLFCRVMESVTPDTVGNAVYATIVGSNLGALFTPVGALAGIMWSSILNEHKLKFGYLDFLRIGITVAVPALAAALLMLVILL